MQHVTCVKWSLDNRYILSGSDETNIRIWKAVASEKLGKVNERKVAWCVVASGLEHRKQAMVFLSVGLSPGRVTCVLIHHYNDQHLFVPSERHIF